MLAIHSLRLRFVFIVSIAMLIPGLTLASSHFDENECQICMEAPKDVIFSCGHSICRSCYGGIKHHTKSGEVARCPFCRAEMKEKRPCFSDPKDLHSRDLERARREQSGLVSVNELYSAIRHGRTKKVKQAMCHFNLSVVDRYGNSPLHIAAQNGKSKIARYLLSLGFDPNAQNRNGQTPLHYANVYRYKNVADLLIEVGAKNFLLNQFGLSPEEGISREKPGL